jgi:FtsZ-binding cell division protein ZapB
MSYEVTCYERRPVEEISDAIQLATETINILQMDLESIKHDSLESILKALEQRDRLNVRILTLDPESTYIASRSRQLDISIGQHKDQVRRNILEVVTALSDFRERASVRIYDDYPTQITFTIDSLVYVCTIAKEKRSRQLCTFKLDRKAPGVRESFESQFDSIWKISTDFR